MREMPTLPPLVNLPEVDHEILALWKKERTFEASLRQTLPGQRWTFYEGPPTANGMPGIHHVEARVFKDMFPRFKTMQGCHVPRKAGWDCHGLPVEVAVEKELGLSGKQDIERYGIAEFNQRCRESVARHVDAFAALTTRMGYWTDLEGAYQTMDAPYVESVWWALKQLHDKGLLAREVRVSPYCPRCGTALSEHELGQAGVYREVTGTSVTVRLTVTSAPAGASKHLAGASLLAWTAAPWTLVANAAVAVHPDVSYVIARKSRDGDKVVIAESLYARVLGEGWHILAYLPGSQLAGAGYQRPFDLIDVPQPAVVVPAEFVTTGDGTGLVPVAPAFGADDLQLARDHGLPVVSPVGPDGLFEPGMALAGGLLVTDADRPLAADLAERGLLFGSAPHVHSCPHCWRCGTALLQYAGASWQLATTAIKAELLAENDKVRWTPEAVKDGRYGEWLRTAADWTLSRSRYWGTPLPLWECPAGHVTCAGSLAELSELAGTDLSGLDPHRPFADAVRLRCPECGAQATRVPEVTDAWFDSGAMPFAQHGAPLRNQDDFEAAYPAQFICEAVDQTRGWFYALMAAGTALFGRSPYENVACLGHVVDDQGRKMSKNLGNVLAPMGLLEEHGADAVRWFFAASGSPWGQRRIGPGVLAEVTRKVLLPYYASAASLSLCARAAAPSWSPDSLAGPGTPAPADRPLLDRWLLSQLHGAVAGVTDAMEAFDSATAGRRIAALIEDLSAWYLRRSRRRLWGGSGEQAALAGLATLHEALATLTRLMAPVTPFLTDYVWRALRASGDPGSVHLAAWPAADASLVDRELDDSMALARRLAGLGRSARAAAGVATRQPLARAAVSAAGFEALPQELRLLIAQELNVHAVEPATQHGDLVAYQVKPDFRALGQRFGPGTQAVAAAIRQAPAARIAAQLAAGPVTLAAPPLGEVEITGADVVITVRPRAGWQVAASGGELVALELAVTPELRAEGLAREVVARIQQARKAAGLSLTDRITVRWDAASAELAGAITAHGELIASEVLATSLASGTPRSAATAREWAEHSDPDVGLRLWLHPAAAGSSAR